MTQEHILTKSHHCAESCGCGSQSTEPVFQPIDPVETLEYFSKKAMQEKSDVQTQAEPLSLVSGMIGKQTHDKWVSGSPQQWQVQLPDEPAPMPGSINHYVNLITSSQATGPLLAVEKEMVWVQVPIAVDSGACAHVTPPG